MGPFWASCFWSVQSQWQCPLVGLLEAPGEAGCLVNVFPPHSAPQGILADHLVQGLQTDGSWVHPSRTLLGPRGLAGSVRPVLGRPTQQQHQPPSLLTRALLQHRGGLPACRPLLQMSLGPH